jgi:hypothetical protein
VSVETLAIIGAATGVIGALTGVASLAWQVVTHRSSGRLVDLTCSYNVPVYGPPGAQQLGDDHQVAVKVTNAGGAPVTVTNYGVSMAGGKARTTFSLRHPFPGPQSCPAQSSRVESSAELPIPVYDLRHVSKARGIPFSRMRPWVDLGDG